MALVQIVGGNFQDVSGRVLANGTVTLVLNQDAVIVSSTSPLTLLGQIASGTPVTLSLDGTGNVPVSPAVYIWSNDEMQPLGTFYIVNAYDSDGARVWGPLDASIPNVSPFNLELLVPVSTDASGGSTTIVVDYAAMTVNPQTISYTAVLGDANNVVTMNVAGVNTFTVPPHSSVAFPIGTSLTVVQKGAGQITLTPGAGVTIRTPSSLTTRAQFSTVTLVQITTNEWIAGGDLT